MSTVVKKVKNCPAAPISTLTAIEQQDMYGQCCCCLELPCLKSLWSEYSWMGQIEVYGRMIKDCFNVTWPQDDKTKHQICEVCITQLRNAMQFKHRIVKSHSSIYDIAKTIKSEPTDEDVNEGETIYTCTNTMIDGDNKHIVMQENVTKHEDNDGDNEIDDDAHSVKSERTEIYDVHDDASNVNKTENTNSSQQKSVANTRKKTENGNLTKKKTEQSNKRGQSGRRRQKMTEVEKKAYIELRNQDYIKPRQNICLILEHSTIIPFKSYKGYFTCFYCHKQHAAFDELKAHANQSHANINFKSISKCIAKPQNPIKADISDITCRKCKKKIDNLDDLVIHLKNEHNIKFVDDKTKMADRILGYDLSDGKYKCSICKSEFLFFKTLTSHMNSHSNSHVCDVCGQCFLLYERLKAHSRVHSDGNNVKCEICGKICGSQFALKSHIRYTHKKILYMCFICDEKFPTYSLKVKHLEEVHKRKFDLKCKLCPKEYSTPKGLNSHVKTEHLKKPIELKHCCGTCDMKFKSMAELASHLIVHSGEKNHECEFCHKKYSRAKTLTEHLKIHRNDRRWTCGACEQAFVQKCSLKNHIRVHHGSTDYEGLIVYKKPEPE